MRLHLSDGGVQERGAGEEAWNNPFYLQSPGNLPAAAVRSDPDATPAGGEYGNGYKEGTSTGQTTCKHFQITSFQRSLRPVVAPTA